MASLKVAMLQGVCVIGTLAACGFQVGCGVGSHSSGTTTTTTATTPPFIQFSQDPPSSMITGTSATIDAVVENSTSNPLVTYAVSCAPSTVCGSFSTSSQTGVTVYTAPAVVPSSGAVTITATSVANPSLTTFFTVQITAAVPITVVLSGTELAGQSLASTSSLIAIVNNDLSANPQVQWTVACASAACGSFSPVTTASAAATAYTAPAALPAGNSVTVTATSVTDPTKSASAAIPILAQAPSLANGAYIFQFTQVGTFQGIGNFYLSQTFVTGAFTARNGMITGGEQDSITFTEDPNDNDNIVPLAVQSNPIQSGSYTVAADGALQISLVPAQGSPEILAGTLLSSGNGTVAQLFGSLGNGTIDLQTATSAPAGGYAVSLAGAGPTQGSLVDIGVWMGGILNFDSTGGISGKGSSFDDYDPTLGTIPYQKSLASSTVSAPDSFGRVHLQLYPASGSFLTADDLIGYIVDSTHIRLISSAFNQKGYYQGVMMGSALGQGANTGKFTSTSLTALPFVFAVSSNPGVLAVGQLTAHNDGAVSGSLYPIQLTNSQALASVTGTWTVDPTGRVTLSNLTDGASVGASINLYLTGDGNALALFYNQGPYAIYFPVLAGQAYQQQTSLTTASLSGSYALNGNLINGTNFGIRNLLGNVVSTPDSGTNTLSGFTRYGTGSSDSRTYPPGSTDFALSGSLAPLANGLFTGSITGLDGTALDTPGSFALYLIDANRAILVETDYNQTTFGYLQHQ